MSIDNLYLRCSLVMILGMSIILPQAVLGITVKEEEDLSREVMRVVRAQFELIDDPIINDYVNKVGNRIVAVLPEQLFSYHFYVIDADTYNAFATPAGHIFIYRGLMEAMEQEEELAGILGHEVAHVYCRHISQKIERSKKISMATLAGIAAGALLGVGGAGAAAQAVTAGSIAASQSVVLAYSRENEIQADQFGLKFLNQAGYNGKGLLKTLKKIRAKQWYGPDQVPTYLMTHPAVEDRIAYIDRWLTNKGQSQGVLPEVPATEFERIHTRMFTRFGDEQTVRQTFKNELAKHPDDPMAHYRYALILARLGQRQEAIGHMRTALSQRAFDPYLLNDLGRIYYLDGQFNEALNVLKTVAGMLPDDPECLFYLGRTYLEMNNLQAASATFYTLIDKHPNFAQAHYFLGQSLGKQDKLAEAHYQLGIYQHLEGDLRAAKMQFERALKHDPETNLKQRIQEELERIEALKPKEQPS